MKREITAEDFIEELVGQRNAALNDAATRGAVIKVLEREVARLRKELESVRKDEVATTG